MQELSTPLTIDQMLGITCDASAVSDLQEYFGVIDGVVHFTGARFDFLQGGGDRVAFAHRLTADDLIAVQLLGVVVPRRVALDLLEGHLGDQLASELSVIPTTTHIGSADAMPMLVDGGPADRAWKLLEEPDGMGWVTAGKLLARKRPHLLPVYDRVVRCAFGAPAPMWTWLQGHFADRGGELSRRLEIARSDARLPTTLSLLRVLDVIVWMRHRAAHSPIWCRGLDLPTS